MTVTLKNISAPEVVQISDPFADLDALRLSQDFAAAAGVKKLLTTVPIRRPNPQDFVRVHPEAAYRGAFSVIDLKDDREMYLVMPAVVPALTNETVAMVLHTAISRQGVLFLWPVRLPPPDGRDLEWHRSAREAAARAFDTWVRVKANMHLNAYEISAAESLMAEPEWPSQPFNEILRIAFRDRVVTSLDHPVVKRLRGFA